MPLLMLLFVAVHAPLTPVQAFLRRREHCAHWAGEESYDRARAAQIASAIRDLRCHMIEADESQLRRRHARTPDILRLFDGNGPE